MTEVYKAIDIDTKQTEDVTDPEPLKSSVLFKKISDKIWESHPGSRLASTTVPSVLEPQAALTAINKVVRSIDRRFVVFGADKPFEFEPHYPDDEPVVLTAEDLSVPSGVKVGTFNWDERNGFRIIAGEDEHRGVEFIDGHKDYHRELFAKFFVENTQSGHTSFTYSLQRIQPQQDQTTTLSLVAWNSTFAETGYEGHSLLHRSMTEKQELKVLRAFQAVGGIALDAAT